MEFEFQSLLATSDSLAGDTGYSVVVILAIKSTNFKRSLSLSSKVHDT